MYLSGIIKFCVASTLIGYVLSVPLNKISKHPVILVVSFDGFRHDYLNKVDTPALNELKNDGISVPYMEPVFPTMTFPNHQSIATGLYSESHGIVDNEFFDPLLNKTLSGFSDDEGFWNYHPDVLPIWIRNEMAEDGRKSGCLMWPGSSEPYGPDNNLRPTYYYPGYNANVTWEERVDTIISWINDDLEPANLVFLYYNEPDSTGHGHGPNHNATLEEIRKADNRTAYLVKKLKDTEIFDKINLIILSDHGMQDVTSQRIVNISQLIDSTLVEAQHGGTPVLQLNPKEGKGEELYAKLSEESKTNNFTIWKKEQMEYRFRYSKSRRVQEYILIADPGYAFDDFYSSMEYYNEKYNLTGDSETEYGVHGYNPETLSMKPLFIAHGPAFRNGLEFQPIRNVDIVPMISAILNLPTVPHNGSLDRVVEMINPAFIPPDDTSSLSSSINLRRPFVYKLIPIIITSIIYMQNST
ncbi:unnamed protein product [Orchesella dallaii]|uniref:Ectonucleotide pyrophosphatase/phosphodiesterase family member 5 n=1 Tax=Orchesella dallaii TaxID=48710 RepID=A0ABP1QW29_9HEXA